jgi:hypothetical protein
MTSPVSLGKSIKNKYVISGGAGWPLNPARGGGLPEPLPWRKNRIKEIMQPEDIWGKNPQKAHK